MSSQNALYDNDLIKRTSPKTNLFVNETTLFMLYVFQFVLAQKSHLFVWFNII